MTFSVWSWHGSYDWRQTGILWRRIVHTDLENKAVSEDLGIVSLQTQQGSLVYCSTQHPKSMPHAVHTVHELHSADLWRKNYTSLATYGRCS